MKRRFLLAGACLVAVLFLALGPAASGEEIHPCTDLYDRCLAIALSADISLRSAYEGMQRCYIFFGACMVVFCL